MVALGVEREGSLREAALAKRLHFYSNGVNVSDWARDRQFNPRLVHQILRGNRSCMRGESHRIAVALGIKSAHDGISDQ